MAGLLVYGLVSNAWYIHQINKRSNQPQLTSTNHRSTLTSSTFPKFWFPNYKPNLTKQPTLIHEYQWTLIVSQWFAPRWEHLPLRSRNGTRRDRRLGDGDGGDGLGRFHGSEPEAMVTFILSTRNFRFPTFVCWIQPCNIVKQLACFPLQTSGCLKLACTPFCLMVKIRELPIRIAYAMVSI